MSTQSLASNPTRSEAYSISQYIRDSRVAQGVIAISTFALLIIGSTSFLVFSGIGVLPSSLTVYVMAGGYFLGGSLIVADVILMCVMRHNYNYHKRANHLDQSSEDCKIESDDVDYKGYIPYKKNFDLVYNLYRNNKTDSELPFLEGELATNGDYFASCVYHNVHQLTTLKLQPLVKSVFNKMDSGQQEAFKAHFTRCKPLPNLNGILKDIIDN